MNTIHSRAVVLTLMLGVSLSGWATNPCMPIAMSCMKLGYYKGGENTGKGLIQDCVMPVVAKTKILSGSSFSDTVLNACNADLMEKMKEQQNNQ